MLVLGYFVSRGGFRVLSQWDGISSSYAGIALLWTVAGPVMLAAAAGILLSRARHRLPLLAGSVASVCAGTSLVVGVLTLVVPCSGPS